MKTIDKISIVFTCLFLILFSCFCYLYRNNIYLFVRDYIIKERDNIVINNNDYSKDDNFLYVKITNDFIIKDKDHIKDVIYTILNSGVSEFTFYCSDDYINCLNDINHTLKDDILLSNINNFVNPYNSFSKIDTTYTSNGKITVDITKNYSNEEIISLNKKIDLILKREIKDSDNIKDKIKAIHNYIVNNGKYKETLNASADKATGILLDGYGMCNSYADAMALFLDKLNIKNYKIASDTHIWNLVYIDDDWYHLDLTWDDPLASDGKDYLYFSFFLITDERLKELDKIEHNYNKDVYLELK